MSKVKIQGNASGTGVLTVTAPNTSTDRTITLPDATGTLLNSDGDGSNLTGISSVGGATGVDFNDNVKARFGTNNDLSIYHDHANSQNVQLSTSIPITFAANDLKFANGANDTLLMKIDNDGHITKPLQSAFLANNNSNQTLSNGSVLQFPTERFDQNGDYNNSTYTFTAPVTGKYFFGGMIRIDDISNSGSYVRMYLRTSNADYAWIINQEVWDQTAAYTPVNVSLLVDMDAADTCQLVWQVGGGGGTPHLDGGLNAAFSGHLVC